MIAVRHKHGKCITKKNDTCYQDSVKTLCNHYVTLPWGFEKILLREISCKECKDVLNKETRR